MRGEGEDDRHVLSRPHASGRIGPVTTGKVVTEVQAFAVLAGVPAYPIASGGVGGSEGCICLTLEGDEERGAKAFEIARSVKGEPPVTLPKKHSISSGADYGCDAVKQDACLH